MIGRFMQTDPIGQAGGLNTYAYCANNPFMAIDPSGEDWQSWDNYWGQVGGVFKGYGSLFNLYEAAQGFGTLSYGFQSSSNKGAFTQAIANAMWSEFCAGLMTDRGPEGYGKSVGSALMVAYSVAAPYSQGGMLSGTTYVTRWDTAAGISAIKASGELRAGSYVMGGRGNYMNYLFSGVYQSNVGYKFGSRTTTLVPRSAVAMPRSEGLITGIAKWAIGQRQIRNTLQVKF